jgi:hypothetical protein
MPDYEQHDLNLFLDLLDDLDRSSCEFTDAPDLIVRHNGQSIGVEHTRLYREDSTLTAGRQLLPQEIIHWQLVERAHEIFRQHSPQLLWLYVTFKEPFNYQQRDIEAEANILAQSVLEVVSRYSDSNTEAAIVRIQSWQAQRLRLSFPTGVTGYDYTVVNDPAMELWGAAYGYGVPKLTPEQIQQVIREKETHLPQYRTRCDIAWLLVVTNTGIPASHFDIPDELKRHLFLTAFERLYLLSPFQRQLTELQIMRNE